MRRHLTALALAALLPLTAAAQETLPAAPPAILVADDLYMTGEDRLIASGNVEALHEGRRLSARRIVYDRAKNQLTLEGPIRITDAEANVVILADAGTLDQEMKNGLLQGARMVMNEQLQLAAVALHRIDGRYTQLTNTAVTSCQVCANGVPLWQVRARKVIHDQEARQIYFEGAQFRIGTVPVMYIPRLRLPDGTLKRARGFLTPEVRSNSALGVGIKVPYFLPLGDHRDLTVTPYLSRETTTVELRYRQAFRRGTIVATGALSRDTLLPDDARGYLFTQGRFDLPRDFKLKFDVELTSDRSYLDDYGYSGKQRLDSAITVSRVRRDEIIEGGLTLYRSLRADEDNGLLPTAVTDGLVERRYFPRFGGELRYGFETHAHYRPSQVDILGRDVARLSAEASWRNRWTLAGGLRLGLMAGVAVDEVLTNHDSTSDTRSFNVTPTASVELRWPLVKRETNSARQLLEPVVQLGWSGGTRPRTPADESTRMEFDEGNLLTLSRFSATDRRARGTELAWGLRWQRHDPKGWSAALTFGQVIRDKADPAFTRSSGLSSAESDLLIAGGLRLAGGLSLTVRGLLDAQSDVTKAEARIGWDTDKIDLSASYVLLSPDMGELRPDTISEWALDGSYRFSRHWTASGEWRYDLVSDRAAKVGLGLGYRTECVLMDFTVTRRYSGLATEDSSTTYGLTVALPGFSTGGGSSSDASYRRTCRK